MSTFERNTPVPYASDVAVRPAATVMIVDDRPELEVLMVQRTSRAVFGPSAWVFPGGRVDPGDSQQLDQVTTGITDGQASAMLGVEANGRAWWFAGLRETLEEAGLLVGAYTNSAGALAPQTVDALRTAVHARAGDFAQALVDNGVKLDLGAIYDVARFTTPVGPPRRFDTRFFLAAAPSGQVARPDEQEVVNHTWVRPQDAMAAWRDGDFPMMSVTHRMLACLARYESLDQLMSLAATRPDPRTVRINDPDGAYEVLLPGDVGYESAEVEIEHGWVRI